MKRTGLQKNIAFIFDGSEAAPETAAVQAVSPIAQTLPPSVKHSSVGSGPNAPAPGLPASLRPQPIHRQHAGQAQIINPGRVIGYVKNQMALKKSKTGGGKQQQKMAMLVAVLAIVFVGVLFLVIGTSPSKVAAAAGKNDTAAHSAAGSAGINAWKIPEPYPANRRDPMKWASHLSSDGAAGDSALLVRGIVYSQTKPSAIVSGQIVNQGDTIAGVKVLTITKDYVEFQKDDKTWKQQVEK